MPTKPQVSACFRSFRSRWRRLSRPDGFRCKEQYEKPAKSTCAPSGEAARAFRKPPRRFLMSSTQKPLSRHPRPPGQGTPPRQAAARCLSVAVLPAVGQAKPVPALDVPAKRFLKASRHVRNGRSTSVRRNARREGAEILEALRKGPPRAAAGWLMHGRRSPRVLAMLLRSRK